MIEYIVSSTVLIAVSIAVRYIFYKKISRCLQYALWGLIALRLLIPVNLWQSPVSIMSIMPEAGLGSRQVYLLPISKNSADDDRVVISDDNAKFDENSFGYPVLSDDGTTVTRYFSRISVAEMLKYIWVTGSSVTLMWFFATNIIFYHRLRRTRHLQKSANCKLPLYECESIVSPCLFGIFRPSIYLTSRAFEGEELSAHVITHELCHYHHGDHLWSAVRVLCLSIWWWNPLVWAAAALSQADSELACDESTVKILGSDSRLSYGRTLVGMIAIDRKQTKITCASTAMVSGKRSITKRIERIVQNPKPSVTAAITAIAIIMLTAGCTFAKAPDMATNNTQLSYMANEYDSLICTDVSSKREITVNVKGMLTETQLNQLNPGDRLWIQHKGQLSDKIDALAIYVVLPGVSRTYSFDEVVFMNPFSSYYPVDTTGYLYCVGADGSFIILNENDGQVHEQFLGLDWSGSEVDMDDWNKSFRPPNAGTDISHYGLKIQYPISDQYRLLQVNEELWLITYGTPGTVWSIFKLKPATYESSDVNRHLDRLMSIIISSPSLMSSHYAYINEHSEEYAAFTECGDDALRYIFRKFLSSREAGLDGMIMVTMLHDMMGSELPELTVGDSQSWFDAWKDYALNQAETNGMEYMRSNMPKTSILLMMLEDSD